MNPRSSLHLSTRGVYASSSSSSPTPHARTLVHGYDRAYSFFLITLACLAVQRNLQVQGMVVNGQVTEKKYTGMLDCILKISR